MKPWFTASLCLTLLLLSGTSTNFAADDLSTSIETIRSVGKEGENNPAARQAWAELSQADASGLTTILRGMQGANPLARNYLRAAFETIASHRLEAGKALPLDDLKTFLADHSQSPHGRRIAFEWIVRIEPEQKSAMLADMINDPSLEIRYDAVAQALEKAARLQESESKAEAVRAYELALAAARNQEQIKAATKALRDMGERVDLPLVFGFIVDWKMIGPFDNVDRVGFAAVYPPEEMIDLDGKYPGKEADVTWIDHTTEDEYGVVDLNKAIGKHMGAVGYAFHEFTSDREREAEVRLGCINANKVWLNGELLTANEVYHAGSRIDQYVGRGKLKQGKNAILVKVCQNEQTENWAQNWEFQLRVCDSLGTAILSQTREGMLSDSNTKAASKMIARNNSNR